MKSWKGPGNVSLQAPITSWAASKKGVASGSRKDPPLLLCPHETPPRVLNPALKPEVHAPVRAGPEEEQKESRGWTISPLKTD